MKAGLAAVSKETGRLRDYFFGRVLFPIRDARGAVAAFGGRVLGDGEPKYLNSPESPVFSKGRVLYGLSQALTAVRKAREAVLMEGYMDVIAAHQHGLDQACAPLGTALTPDHVALLKRYASQAVVVFDADNAGINAAVRGAELLLAGGLGVRIATVPEGKDPDEFLRRRGIDGFRSECLGKAVDLVEFKTGLLLGRQKSPLSPEAKSSVAEAVLSTINQSPDEILKGEWVRRLAQRLSVSEEDLRRRLSRLGGAQTPRPAARAAAPAPPRADLSEQDRQVLVLLLKKPELSASAQAEDFGSASGRRIWTAISGLSPWPAGWSARLVEGLPIEDRAAASSLLVLVSELESSEPERVLKGILARRRGEARLKVLEASIRTGDENVKAEYQKLLSDLKGSRR